MPPPDAPRHPSKGAWCFDEKMARPCSCSLRETALETGTAAPPDWAEAPESSKASRFVRRPVPFARSALRASLGRMTGDRAPFQGAVIASGDEWMSRWPPSRPLRRSAQAESEAIGRCGRRTFGCVTPCSRGRGSCCSRSALWRRQALRSEKLPSRARRRRSRCARPSGWLQKSMSGAWSLKLRSVEAERGGGGLVRRGKPQGMKRRRERGAMDALHRVAGRALTGSSSEDRRSGS